MLDGMPNLTQRETNDIYEIVGTLSDPEKAKGWLDKLILAKKRAQDALDIAKIEQAKANQVINEATVKKAQADAAERKSRAEYVAVKARLDQREAFLGEKERELTIHSERLTADMERREAALKKAGDELAIRERGLSEKESVAAAAETAAHIILRTYNAKLAELKRIVG